MLTARRFAMPQAQAVLITSRAAAIVRATPGAGKSRGVADLIEDAGGCLDLTSSPGAGTTVRIEVPVL